MDDEEKKRIAKHNYDRFLTKFQSENIEIAPKQIVAYVTLNDGTVLDDYYWTDNEVTPTRVYRWLMENYNKHSVQRDKWAKKAVLPKRLFVELLDHLRLEETDSFMMDDVMICRGQ